MLAGSSDLDEDGDEAAEASETDVDITVGELENPTRLEEPDGIINTCAKHHQVVGPSPYPFVCLQCLNLAQEVAPTDSLPTLRYEPASASSPASHVAAKASTESSFLPEPAST